MKSKMLLMLLFISPAAFAETYTEAYARGVRDFKIKSRPVNGKPRTKEELARLHRESFKDAQAIDAADRESAARKAQAVKEKIKRTLERPPQPGSVPATRAVESKPSARVAAPASEVKAGGADGVTFKGAGAPVKDESGANAGGAESVKFSK